MEGYPTRWVKLNASAEQRRRVIYEYVDAYDSYTKLREAAETHEAITRVKERHQFQLCENEQFRLAFVEYGHGAAVDGHDDMSGLARKRARLPWSSNVSEESIGAMKKQVRVSTRKYRNIETVMGNVIRSDALTARNKYDSLVINTPFVTNSERLPQSAFSAGKKTRSLAFNELVTTGEGCKHYSPNAANAMCPSLGHKILGEVKKLPNAFENLDSTMLNHFIHVSHRLVFKKN